MAGTDREHPAVQGTYGLDAPLGWRQLLLPSGSSNCRHSLPWYSSSKNDFNADFGLSTDKGESFGLSVFVRKGARAFRTYFTAGRGVETLGTAWTFLDLTPLGRQEDWEDSPKGRSQTPALTWWRRHDEY